MATKTTPFPLASIPCSKLKGIGPKLAENLTKYGIYNVQDLLFHLPTRYQDRTRITPIRQARLGDHVVIEGNITAVEVSRGRKPSLLCHLLDTTGHLTLRFFHFSDKQRQSLSNGVRLRCFGEIRGWGHQYELIHPEYEFVNDHTPPLREDCLTPIYPLTDGLTQRHFRIATDQALDFLNEEHVLPDYIPESLLEELQLPSLIAALRYVHRPPPQNSVAELLAGTHPVQQRLAFEELMAHQLCLRKLRQNIQEHPAPVLHSAKRLSQQLLNSLPFQLTKAQEKVYQEIATDMSTAKPMLRLLQGDVGSGKTIVAALVALQANENNYQAALMAPTELLAEQHFQNFTKWLEPLKISVAWVSGKLKGKAREVMLEKISSGDAHVVIGTHALFQHDVKFSALGLVMIDEQHRFGVDQRLALREKGLHNGCYPHQLIMTATPIPRTLAMTAYADLDNSIIDELPPGRTPVQTVVISNKRRAEVISHVQKACKEQKQVYWVCPLIEESEALQCQAAETTAEQLTKFLPELRIGLVHGRMNALQKEEAMALFKSSKTDLLVATTVIEVGVDVPNASLMVIENSERLGLAQLHQLRGRVGRGSIESFCVLLYQADRLSNLAKSRLAAMRETNDGFVLARRDLELRGPGEVLGTKQAGVLQLRIADLLRDHGLLPKVQKATEILLRDFPHLVDPLIQRWLAQEQKYGGV